MTETLMPKSWHNRERTWRWRANKLLGKIETSVAYLCLKRPQRCGCFRDESGFKPGQSRHLSKCSYQPESRQKRLDGVENVCECRRGCWSYLRGIGVVDVVIAAVKQIQKFGRNAPFRFNNLITDLPIEQGRCIGAINSVRRQIARAKVAQAQTRRKPSVIVQCDRPMKSPPAPLRAQACPPGRPARHFG